jgi:hypothetical protein
VSLEEAKKRFRLGKVEYFQNELGNWLREEDCREREEVEKNEAGRGWVCIW